MLPVLLANQGAAKENRKSVNFWKTLSARAMVVAPSMQPSDTASVNLS
jgi:hypothetical protein